MTIKLPVYVDHDEAESAWWVADADGEPVDLFAIADALNATQPAPDLTALREAVETCRAATSSMEFEQRGTEDYFAARDMARAAREDIVTAALTLFPQDGDA